MTAHRLGRIMGTGAAITLAGLIGFADAEARQFTESEKKSLTELLQTIVAAAARSDVGPQMDAMSPKVIRYFAERLKMSEDVYRKHVLSQFSELHKQAKILSEANVLKWGLKIVSAGFELERIGFGETKSGLPFALVAYAAVMKLDDGLPMREKEYNVAFIEDGKWRVLRVNDMSMMVMLREVYPEFVGIEIPMGSKQWLPQ